MGKDMLVNSDNMRWLNKWLLKEWKEFLKFQKCRNFWKPWKHGNSSGNLRSAGMFQKLQKHGNNLWQPQNASVSLETLEGHLVGILTLGLSHMLTDQKNLTLFISRTRGYTCSLPRTKHNTCYVLPQIQATTEGEEWDVQSYCIMNLISEYIICKL